MGISEKYGWRFPVGADPKTGAISATSYETDIRQSILILLGTRPGERIGRPGYGCGLLRFTFESVSHRLIEEICSEIKEALNNWEDRIENVSVSAVTDGDDGYLAFIVSYDISKMGARDEVRYELNIG